MRKGLIYCLVDPRDNLVKYIGQTISLLKRRYNQHLVDYKRRNCKVNSWIKHLSKLKLKPIIEIIENDIDQDKLDEKEISYIALFKSVGANLKNHTIGGKGHKGEKMSESSKTKRSITNKNSKRMLEKHKNHSNLMKDRYKLGLIKFPQKTLESIKKQSQSIKIKRNKNPELWKNLINSRKRSIVSMDMSGNILMEFESIKDAANHYNIFSTSITQVCKGKYKQYLGYKFKYKQE